jgi:hypothetical protein
VNQSNEGGLNVSRTKTWALCALGVLAASAAGAGVVKGGTLYIKGQDVKLLSKADLGASAVTKLKNGDAVTWQGPDAKNKDLHAVEAGKKKGFVFVANLTPNKPIDEYPKTDGKPTSAEAFKSSGAATKAMTEAGLKYAEGTGPSAQEAAAGVIHLEGSSEDAKGKVKDFVKKQGLGGDK